MRSCSSRCEARAESGRAACARVVSQAYGPAVFNVSVREPYLCWIHGQQKEGLGLNRPSRLRLRQIASERKAERDAWRERHGLAHVDAKKAAQLLAKGAVHAKTAAQLLGKPAKG